MEKKINNPHYCSGCGKELDNLSIQSPMVQDELWNRLFLIMAEFPKYVGIMHPDTQKWSSALILSNVKNNFAIYERPPESGGWHLEAAWINDQLIVTNCLGNYLIGQTLVSITEQEFRDDNRR